MANEPYPVALGVRLVAGAIVALASSGCQTSVPPADNPARIVDADAASRASLQTTLNEVLKTEVLIADDALTRSSLLSVERRLPRSLQGQPAGGRILTAPIQFQLVLSNGECVLIDLRDSSRHVLQDTRCVAEASN